MAENNEEIKLPPFFDKDPELKARVMEKIRNVSPEEKKKLLDEFFKFVNGDLTWGEIIRVSKRLQKEVARIAYLKFKMKEYDRAESLFKTLAVLDHTNWYYRAALGAIYQKQRKFEEAVTEYDKALMLKEEEVSCRVNRGECFMNLGAYEQAKKDFSSVMKMKLPRNNPWLMRTRVLSQRLVLAEGRQKEKEAHE